MQPLPNPSQPLPKPLSDPPKPLPNPSQIPPNTFQTPPNPSQTPPDPSQTLPRPLQPPWRTRFSPFWRPSTCTDENLAKVGRKSGERILDSRAKIGRKSGGNILTPECEDLMSGLLKDSRRDFTSLCQIIIGRKSDGNRAEIRKRRAESGGIGRKSGGNRTIIG